MTNETEWLGWRRTGLGAGDIARAHTGHYGGAYAVVAEKLGRLTNDIDPADAQRGHDWEHAIADGVHALTGYYVHGEQLWVTSPENKRWLATIDGLLSLDPQTTFDDAAAVLEVKTSRQYVSPKWDYYEAQVQWQMLVCGKQRALVAVAVIGMDPDGNEGVRDLKLRWIERDDDLIGQLIDLAMVLWSHVEAGTLPPVDVDTRLSDVKVVHRVAAPETIIDIDDVEQDIAELMVAKQFIKDWTEYATKNEAVIRDRMGEATEAVTSDGRWRVRVGQPVQRFTDQSEDAALLLAPEFGVVKLDRQRFKAEKPELYEELKVPTTDRRLTVKELTE